MGKLNHIVVEKRPKIGYGAKSNQKHSICDNKKHLPTALHVLSLPRQRHYEEPKGIAYRKPSVVNPITNQLHNKDAFHLELIVRRHQRHCLTLRLIIYSHSSSLAGIEFVSQACTQVV